MRRFCALAVCLVACSYSPTRVTPSSDAPVDDTAVLPDTPVDCPEGFDIQYGGHCYRGTFSFAGWSGARDSCQAMQAALMVIETAGEDAELYSQLAVLGVSRVWVGLRDTNSDGLYEWVDGTTTATHGYSHFDEPPGAGEADCVFVGGTSQGQDLMGRWFFDSCNQSYFAVCERLPL